MKRRRELDVAKESVLSEPIERLRSELSPAEKDEILAIVVRSLFSPKEKPN